MRLTEDLLPELAAQSKLNRRERATVEVIVNLSDLNLELQVQLETQAILSRAIRAILDGLNGLTVGKCRHFVFYVQVRLRRR